MKFSKTLIIFLLFCTFNFTFSAELTKSSVSQQNNDNQTKNETENNESGSNITNDENSIESQDDEKPPENIAPKKPSQVKEIENSIYEESSEFESADVFKNSSVVEIQKIYEMIREWQTFTTTEDREDHDESFHLLVVKGYGQIELMSGDGDQFQIVLNRDYEISYIPLNSKYYLTSKGSQMKFRWRPNGKDKKPAMMKLTKVTGIDMEFNQNHRVITQMVDEVRYRVRRPDLHLNQEGKDDRLQFILQSSLSEQHMSGFEQISMYVNHRSEFPTQANFDFRATGNLGYGLIKTLNKNNKYYCVEHDCIYYVTIFTKDIDAIFFFPTVFANFSQLKFKKYLFLLEEVEGRETVTYELDVPDHDGDWVFSIEPLEGNPRMFINPDTAPEILGKYKYKGIGGHAEQISITKKEAKKYGFKFTKFFVTFSGNGGNQISTFRFQARKIKSNTIKYFKMDYAETGVVANGEINQYKLNFEVDDPEFISFELQHTAIVGRSILILKECPDGKKNCKINRKDVKTCQKFALYAKTENGSRDVEDRLAEIEASGRRLQAKNIHERILQQNNLNMPTPTYRGQYPNQIYNQGNINLNQTQIPYSGNQSQYVQNANNEFQKDVPLVPANQINTGLGGIKIEQPNTRSMNSNNNLSNSKNQQQVYYYPDQQLGNNVSQNTMINPIDVQYALEKQAQQEKLANQPTNTSFSGQKSGNNPQLQMPKPPAGLTPDILQQLVTDNKHKVIQPNQANLTSQDSQKMLEILSDPVRAQALINSMMKNKDKDIRELYNYKTLEQQQKENQQGQLNSEFESEKVNAMNQSQSNTKVPRNESNPDAFVNSELQQLPEETDPNYSKEYELEREFNESDIRCVEAIGGQGRGWNTKKILMEFNCVGPHNSNTGQTFEYLDPNYVFSTHCNFAVGVFGSNQDSKNFQGSYYSVTGQGGLTHKKLYLKKSKEIIVEKNEKKYIRYDLSHWRTGKESKIQVKVIGITGSCEVLFSKFNPYPTEYDNEASLSFQGEHFMSVRTSEKTVMIDYDTKGQYASLFASIEASEYCVLDFYAQRLSVDDQHDDSHNEALSKGKMIRRRIRERDLDENVSHKKMKYIRRFHFEIKEEVFSIESKLKVVLNSNTLGLKICLQANQKLFDPSKKCDIQSHRGVAEIEEDEHYLGMGSFWAIGIIYETDQRHPKLPIEFSLVYIDGKDADTHLHLLNPGRVFQSHIKVGETMIFKVNLLTVQESSTLILTSEDKSVKGEVSLSRYDFSDIKYELNNEKFAVEVNHSQQEILCHEENAKDQQTCVFYVRVTSASKHRTRFSLTYTFDDVPITLKEGHELFIPNKHGVHFLYDPDPNYPAELNLQSELTEFVIYAKLITLKDIKRNQLGDLLNEMEFDFKTDISTSEQLSIPQKRIADVGTDVLIAYYIVPKFFRNDNQSNNIYYHTSETTRVMVKSHMSQLTGFTQGVAKLNKGEFRHFFFSVENAKDFSLVLTVLSGHADLYLNKGLFNLPTKKNYWKRRRGSRGEELLITTKMFEHPKDIKGVYTAGIYAESNARVSVFFLPAFKNLINLKMQHMVNIQLKKSRNYYFEFYNKLPMWDTDLYSANSSLEVSIMDYKLKKKGTQNLMELIEDDRNYDEHLHFDKGSIPLKHHEESPETSRHYVVRVRALDEDAALNIAVYDPRKPVIIPSHKRISMVGNEKSEYIYKIELTGSFEEAKIDFKLSFGKLKFSVSNTLSGLDNAKSHRMSVAGSKDIKFTAPAKKSDIIVFEEIFIKVETEIFSNFSILVRGAEQFHEIREAESEIVYTSPKQDQFIYFYMNATKARRTKSIIFDVYMVNYYSDKPAFLFNPDDEDIELGKETKLLPMARLDYHEKKTREFNHIELRAEVRKGFYVVKIPKANHRVPVKISVGLDDRRRLEVNGVYRSQLPGGRIQAHKYSVFLPGPGEFRFLVESCKKAGITHAELKFPNADHSITFAQNLYEAHHFLQIDDRDPTQVKKMLSNYNQLVFRGQNDYESVLEFEVEKNAIKKDLNLPSVGQDYLLLSEFKPTNRNVFFREYIDLWSRTEKINEQQMSFLWTKRATNLQVSASMPRFRDQLMLDYPSLKKIVIKMFIFVFDDPDFKKRLDQCGLEALEEIPHAKRESIILLNIPDDLNLPKPVSYTFNELELEKFKNSPSLSIFTYMSISFFEDELEEFEINLDLKFTNVPYFHFITANQYSRSAFSFLKMGVFLLVLVFVMCLVYFKCKSDSSIQDIADMVTSTERVRAEYETPGFANQRSQIQMSDLSA